MLNRVGADSRHPSRCGIGDGHRHAEPRSRSHRQLRARSAVAAWIASPRRCAALRIEHQLPIASKFDAPGQCSLISDDPGSAYPPADLSICAFNATSCSTQHIRPGTLVDPWGGVRCWAMNRPMPPATGTMRLHGRSGDPQTWARSGLDLYGHRALGGIQVNQQLRMGMPCFQATRQ